ncbi:bifunctional 4-hydroxy-2-oxoglutarate aldolase/2-dehydro-3-deoxy-phosphogluconate aldolase [Candidatus Electronema sp. PJ]|uniref:bifunctional 4-hydroxy-2-oxoglutarate aldolase/2-dehydro-3-deoxy-phosphogluconate aldolase n=1 Tax=Candidatus Electronema sp. PJ TaxID=3401572 RepID=UPI003AA937AA
MANERGKLSPLEILHTGPVVPVVVLRNADHAVSLAKALLAGGIRVMEITLRSGAAALDGIRRISAEVPEIIVGAGTVLTSDDLRSVAQVGGQFAISPGLTPSLFAAAHDGPIPLIPGIATASELMLAQERGFTELKFFPAEAAGGVPMLKALHGPFPRVTFCPTGGISQENCKEYLTLANVACVGGSWLTPPELLEKENWDAITELAAKAAGR